MKNIISRHLFGTDYNQLPLASEIIVDIQMECFRNKILALLLFAAFVFSIVGGVICSMV